MNDFISEDDLKTFEGYLKYQAIDPAALTPDELKLWQSIFEEARSRCAAAPKVGLIKLQRVSGEQKYAVAIHKDSALWLTLWVRCSRKGEVFIMYPRGDRDWDAHASYHSDGTLHQKSYGKSFGDVKRQPLTGTFKGCEQLGLYGGHGTTSGAVCDPSVFDGVVIVGPDALGPRHGVVAIDLMEPGVEPPRFLGKLMIREIFPRDPYPSLVITIGQQ
jgi:hypothetical protein